MMGMETKGSNLPMLLLTMQCNLFLIKGLRAYFKSLISNEVQCNGDIFKDTYIFIEQCVGP